MDPKLVGRIKSVQERADRPPRRGGRTAGASALTTLQRAYLLGRSDVFEIGDVASHVYHEIEGVWDIDRLESALEAVVDAHSALRTRFAGDGRQVSEFRQYRPRIPRLDLRGRARDEQRRIRRELREQRSHRVLAADRVPLIAVEVTILADDRMVLHVSHDGLVMDGISMFLFFHAWWAALPRRHRRGRARGAAVSRTTSRRWSPARDRAPTQRSRELLARAGRRPRPAPGPAAAHRARPRSPDPGSPSGRCAWASGRGPR